jgi:hypothetical protein
MFRPYGPPVERIKLFICSRDGNRSPAEAKSDERLEARYAQSHAAAEKS